MSNYFFSEKDAQKLEDVEDGQKTNGYKASKLKDHLYMTYLMLGIIAFGFGILVSYRRLKNND